MWLTTHDASFNRFRTYSKEAQAALADLGNFMLAKVSEANERASGLKAANLELHKAVAELNARCTSLQELDYQRLMAYSAGLGLLGEVHHLGNWQTSPTCHVQHHSQQSQKIRARVEPASTYSV